MGKWNKGIFNRVRPLEGMNILMINLVNLVNCPRCSKPIDNYEFVYDKGLKHLSTEFIKIVCPVCKYEGTHNYLLYKIKEHNN